MADDTTTLLVHGLNDEGPGDIVGAAANEADIDPDAIGAIDLDDGTATVDVHGGVADRIVEALDGLDCPARRGDQVGPRVRRPPHRSRGDGARGGGRHC